MSRSDEEWEEAKNIALKMRHHLYEILNLLDDWPPRIDEAHETVREIRYELSESGIGNVVILVNSLIGITTRSPE
jgi:hypothetical protein